jgi:AraC-like DNA-binding protein
VLGHEGIAHRCVVGPRLEISLRFVGASRHLDRHQTEGWMTALLRMFRQLTGRRIAADQVGFVHTRASVPEELVRFFGGEVELGAGEDKLAIPAALADAGVERRSVLPIPGPHCGGARSPEGAAASPTAVENAIAPLLPHGEASAAEIARRMGLSRRTLARRLAAEGLGVETVLEALQRDLAERYLADRGLSISQIAWLLGYRESSTFSRAYKRWTGRSPRAARHE